MEFIEDQEIQPLSVLDNLLVVATLSGHEQLEHHKVGKKDVRFSVPNSLSVCSIILAGVAGEGGSQMIGQSRMAEEFLQLLHLAVRQGVHGVHDDGSGPRLLSRHPSPDCSVKDWDEETHGLARPGPRRNNKALALVRLGYRLLLMAMKPHGIATNMEDLRRRRMQDTL
jgi:hypothetical protein